MLAAIAEQEQMEQPILAAAEVVHLKIVHSNLTPGLQGVLALSLFVTSAVKEPLAAL